MIVRLLRLEVRNVRVINRWNPFKKATVQFQLTRVYEYNKRQRIAGDLMIREGDTINLNIDHPRVIR